MDKHTRCVNVLENNSTTSSQETQTNQDNDETSIVSKEVVTNTIDFTSTEPVETISQTITLPSIQTSPIRKQTPNSVPLLIFSRPTSFIMKSPEERLSEQGTTKMSQIETDTIKNQPKSLFLLTLAKLNESSISLAITNKSQINNFLINSHKLGNAAISYKEPSPPDSLTSAPPSYSFVLRQMNARRRPRLMGTFIPSPSFVTHSPPPNYAAAFDIYLDNNLPPITARVYHFGFTPTPVICTECGYTGMTMVRTKVTLCTHMCAFMLCIFCCWICAPLPYILRSCKDVYHYCRNCRNCLGMYCPTNPETNT